MHEESLILHNYAFSPFAQKVRSMLGYADLAWLSVEVPPQPPRPSLDPMITGYRKSPVAQIGADLFCDTRTIAQEIARLSGRPELSVDGRSEQDLAWLEHLEGPVFAACLGALPKAWVLWKLLTNLGLGLPAFLRDRAALGSAGGLDVPSGQQAARDWQEHLDQLDEKVGGGFLGGQTPDHFDFAAYHPIWFFELMSDTSATDSRRSLARWKSRIAAFGNGRPESLSGDEAVAIASRCQPRAAVSDCEDPNLGRRVRIAPTDYGRDDTEGTLVAATAHRWTLRRTTETCGDVQVHFPTRGYRLA